MTPTDTVTPTRSATYTLTPTVTLTVTITRTLTISPTPTISATDTVTATSTPRIPRPEALFYPNPALLGAPVYFLVTVPPSALDGASGMAEVEILVLNSVGEQVSRLSCRCPAGNSRVNFDVSSLAAGIYFYRARIGGKTLDFHKLVLYK